MTTRELPARLYDLETAEVIQAKFIYSGTTSGNISFVLPSGEKFEGEYSTVPSGSITWGSIYTHANGGGSSEVRSKSLKYYGSAVLISDKKTVIECEYVTNSSRYNPQGHGACRDNRGKKYKLMF